MSKGEVTCPLCGSHRAAPLFTKRQTAYWACAACTFRFATPDVNPNLTQTLDGYEDAYLQYLAPDASDSVNFEALYRWMAGLATLEGTRLLDVGAGSGKLVRFLRGRGIDARGIEPSRALFDRFSRVTRSSRPSRSTSCTHWPRRHSTSSPRSTSSSMCPTPQDFCARSRRVSSLAVSFSRPRPTSRA